MGSDTETIAGIGHNQPMATDLARERVEALCEAANRCAAECAEIADAQTAARVSDFLDQLSAEARKIEAERKAEKQSHIDAAAEVDRRWRPLGAAIEACLTLLHPRHSAWLRREQQRLETERRIKVQAAENARREAEAAARKAAAPQSVRDIVEASEAERRAATATAAAAAVPERAQSRGAVSGRVRSLRTTWHARVDDPVEATIHYLDHPGFLAELREVLARRANADARGGAREIPGCTVYPTQE